MPNFKLLLSAACLVALSPIPAFACACGCGVFDVSTGTMMPTSEGGQVWLEYDYLNQTQNWSGASAASRADNSDKLIHTDFITAGGQYMFNRAWGAEIEVPYWNRNFKTETDMPNPGDAPTFNMNGIGDIRVKGIYTGFSEDMSTGATFGLKLPSGNFNSRDFDRDTDIGSGSTDLLLGGFHQGSLTDEAPFNWFVNGQWDHAFITQQNYRPGDEFGVAVGSYYDGFYLGNSGKLVPLFQLIGSIREHDIGMNATTVNGASQSGYQRLLVSPGIEYDIEKVKLYADVEVPVYQNVNGDQLTAPVAFKFVVGYSF
jgi:hypothetical protein